MHRTLPVIGLTSLLVALLAALVPARSAHAAADPALLVSRQLALIDLTTDRAHATMVRICENTVAVVQRLDTRAVANGPITTVGNRGKTQIDTLGARTELSLERSTARMVTRLQRLNADQALIDQLNAALAQARVELNASEAETKAPIDAAVTAATSN